MLRSTTWGLLVLLLLTAGARAQVTLPVIDTESARRAGVSDGESDGGREGEARAGREGEERGFREGRDRAFRETTESLQRRAFDEGIRDGRYAGASEGQRRGSEIGRQQGLDEGRRQGETEGTERAERDAQANARGPATQAGNAAAEASDASSVGRKEGVVEGDGQALAKAREVDYARGRADYFRQRTSEAVKVTVPLDVKPTSFREDDGFVLAQFNPRRQYPTSEENSAYRGGYESGYERARRNAYDRCYRSAYDRAWSRGRDEGRRDAERRDYSYEKRKGYDQGFREQYDASFENSRVQALFTARAEEAARTSQAVYAERYPGFYDTWFAQYRDEAYKARYEALRTAAREAARASTYAALYPEYAKKLYQQGRVDEKGDLASRPLRISSVAFAGADPDGAAAPGQPLHLQLSLRNYGDAKLGAVTVQVEPVTAGSAYLPVPRLALGKEIPAKSAASGRDLLELQLRREFEGQPLEFQVRVFYKDRLMDTRSVTLTPRP